MEEKKATTLWIGFETLKKKRRKLEFHHAEGKAVST